MDIKAALEAGHSKKITTEIISYIGNDKNRFKELMTIFLNSDYRLTQRAAWPLSFTSIEQPQLVRPYFNKLISKLNEEGNHPAIRRNILRLFQETEVPEKYQTALIDACFRFIQDPAQPVAIIAFAITTAARLCKPFPELAKELLLLLNHLQQYPQTPAIKVRIKKAIKELT